MDARVVVDLTKFESFDLTDDAELEKAAARKPNPRTSPRSTVRYLSNTVGRFPVGLPSAINIIRHSVRASTSRNVPSVSNNERPTKRRKTEPTPMVIDVDAPLPSPRIKRSQTPPTSLYRKSKVSKREIVHLDSDSDDVVEVQPKRFKEKDSIRNLSSDEEDTYARCHAGFDVNDEDLWNPVQVNNSRLSFDIPPNFEHLSVSESRPPIGPRPCPGFAHPLPLPQSENPNHYPNTCRNTLYRLQFKQHAYLPHLRPIQTIHHTRLRRTSRRDNIQPFRQVTSFKTTPGSINKIEQSGSWAAICSAATGGGEDQPHEELNPYNKEGAIMAWNDDVHKLPGHSREWGSSDVKYYTVNDVKFDPCSTSIVSSGNDKSVHVWHHDSDTDSFDLDSIWNYTHVPRDLAFKPGESVLAVAEKTLSIYSDLTSDTYLPLEVFPSRSPYSVGAVIWGRGSTAPYIYASSEPKEESFTGHHRAFDVASGLRKPFLIFSEHGSGDTMDITQDGDRLALLTRGKERKHTLGIYDVRRKDTEAKLSLHLEPFPAEIEGEVISAAFSSDGIYLALGRNDNCTHVYDSRQLTRLLFDYKHTGPSRTNPGNESYGVVKVQWVDKSVANQFGLITGGNDGCVRFWDPLVAHDPWENGRESHWLNGTILAEMSSDIGAFSIGDRHKGERSLIVGDCAGEVSVFDIQPAGFFSLHR